ncbi:hypothetical protein CRE_04397 [Caenorhabditis remanei]|uniref:Palmitoyltransferase n=1 Tax=Caenorhabditis remanei TaxID=31234 RepID=E3NLV3_CAERE|nr:hypothetical protein CRE_04397 [Caenorhabditis remanei]
MKRGALSTIEERTETTSGATSTTSNTSNSGTKMETKMQIACRAAQQGEIQTVRFLLNGHVSANELDQEGCGLLHWAAINNKVDIIELLLSHHANVNLIGGNLKSTPLHWACYNSHTKAVISLIKNGANPTIRNINGETPLHVAANTGNFTNVAYLLVKCEHIKDWRDNLGRSALMNSAAHSFGLFPIRIFTKVDAYLDFASDDTGDTALHTSMARQNMSGAVELICAGADETKKNKDGKTPYDMVNDKFGKHVKEHVKTRNIRENGTTFEKMTSRWFLMQLFTASITGILIVGGLGLFYLTNFWVVLSALVVSVPLTFFFLRKKEMDHFGYLPVTYICWMGMAELALLIFDSDGFIHWSLLMVMCTIWVISASFYWLLILTDPGVMPRSTNPFKDFIEQLETKHLERYCFTCWIPKTSFSHHCSQCDKCVDGFDHHCPWIHKCVYRKNLRFFVLFCLTNFIFDVIYVPVLVYMTFISWSSVGFEQTLNDHGIMVLSLLFSVPHIIGAGAITYTQFSQISRHITTIEIIRNTRAKSSSDSDKTTSATTSSHYNPWENRPSMKERIRNIWNLLAFDQFGAEEVCETNSEIVSFETSESHV